MRLIQNSLLLLLLCAHSVCAEFYGGLGIGAPNVTDVSTWPEEEDEDDRDLLLPALKVFAGYNFTDNISIGAGFIRWSSLDTNGSDTTSNYRIKLKYQDFFLAPAFRVDPSWFLPMNFSIGVTYSQVEMRVKESFFGLGSTGEVVRNDSQQGFMLGFGLETFKSESISGVINFHYFIREGFFSESSKPFDMTTIGATFDLAFF